MSELKRCPFCGITLIADGNKFFVHPVVGCLLDGIPIKNDAESIKRWNTRKLMDRIVKRLEIKLSDTVYEKATQESNESHLNGLSIGYCEAIGIVKEEGDLNE